MGGSRISELEILTLVFVNFDFALTSLPNFLRLVFCNCVMRMIGKERLTFILILMGDNKNLIR